VLRPALVNTRYEAVVIEGVYMADSVPCEGAVRRGRHK
jgi:hypothetical protein